MILVFRARGGFFLKVEIKDYNVMIDGKNFFDQPVKIDPCQIFQLVKGMITQLIAHYIIFISKNILSLWQ